MTHLAIAWAILHLCWVLDYHKEKTIGASMMAMFAATIVFVITLVELFS